MPRATNGFDIHTNEDRSVTLDLGLNSMFHGVLIINDVICPIFDINVMQHFDSLVDARRKKVMDRQTSLTVTGWYIVVYQITLESTELPDKQKYSELIREFPSILRHRSIFHRRSWVNSPHKPQNKGFAWSHHPALEKVHLTKAELDPMLGPVMGAHTTPSSPLAYPLCMVPHSSTYLTHCSRRCTSTVHRRFQVAAACTA